MLSADKKEQGRKSRAKGDALEWFLIWTALLTPLFFVHPVLFGLGMVVLIVSMDRHVHHPQTGIHRRLRDLRNRRREKR